jgi:hypothetical protein
LIRDWWVDEIDLGYDKYDQDQGKHLRLIVNNVELIQIYFNIKTQRMPNVHISRKGREILRNKSLARAIVLTMIESNYTNDDDGIPLRHDGKEYKLYTAGQLLTKAAKLAEAKKYKK